MLSNIIVGVPLIYLSLETMHVVHSALLEPYHTQKMSAHLGRVHASGRRSRVLDVGTVSDDEIDRTLWLIANVSPDRPLGLWYVHSFDLKQELITCVLSSSRQPSPLGLTGTFAVSIARSSPYTDVTAIECVKLNMLDIG